MAENSSHRKICVVWTTVKTSEDENGKELETFTDHYQTFEEGDEEKEKATALYEEVLQKDNTFCASLCKILRDSEE